MGKMLDGGPADFDEGREAGMQALASGFCDADEGEGEDDPSVIAARAYLRQIQAFAGLGSYVPPRDLSRGHARGAAAALRDLAQAVDDIADEDP